MPQPTSNARRTVLVTGSSSGIGLAIAKRFQTAGYVVALNGRRRDLLDQAGQQLSIPPQLLLNGDMTVQDDIKAVISSAAKNMGHLDTLICNVGSGASVPPGQETRQEWGRMMDLNFFSSVQTIAAARDLLVQSKGSIVCVSSICGVETIAGAPITYSVAKAALNAFIRGMSRPLSAQGVRINAVAPGNILFEGSVWDKKINKNKELVEKMLRRDVALGRLGLPDDVANLVAWLASEEANFVTGSIYVTDGGQVH